MPLRGRSSRVLIKNHDAAAAVESSLLCRA
jgi:hypothetical protein